MLNAESVYNHFNRICEYGGRLSGTHSEENALDYVSSCLGSLKTGSLSTHPVDYDGWEHQGYEIRIDGHDLEAVPLPGCAPLPINGIELDVVDAGRGTEDELNALASQIQGNAVLVTHEYMFAGDHVHRSRKLDMALSLGAAVFIIANPWPDSGMVAGDASSELPAFGVSWKSGEALRAAASQALPVFFKLDCISRTKTTRTLNWYLPSSQVTSQCADREIIVCAHIDGHELSQSAMDNASGVAVALAFAEQMIQRQSRASAIRLLIFSAEERGLLGSQQYVESLSNAQRQEITGVLNLDCVAGSESLCAMVSGYEFLSKVVTQAAKMCSIPVSIFEPLVPNSDHYNFAVKGIPALRLIAGFGDNDSRLRHVLTSFDTKDLVTRQELEQALKFTMAMVCRMENQN